MDSKTMKKIETTIKKKGLLGLGTRLYAHPEDHKLIIGII